MIRFRDDCLFNDVILAAFGNESGDDGAEKSLNSLRW